MSKPQNITILGATGTIGLQTLDVITRHPERFRVFALSAIHAWMLCLNNASNTSQIMQ